MPRPFNSVKQTNLIKTQIKQKISKLHKFKKIHELKKLTDPSNSFDLFCLSG